MNTINLSRLREEITKLIVSRNLSKEEYPYLFQIKEMNEIKRNV